MGGRKDTVVAPLIRRTQQCSAVQCSAVQCSPVQCSAAQCSPMQCSSEGAGVVGDNMVVQSVTSVPDTAAELTFKRGQISCSPISQPSGAGVGNGGIMEPGRLWRGGC